MTQIQAVERLLSRGWTSPMDAAIKIGCLKLATRVGELRARGVSIEDRWARQRRHKVYRIRSCG